MPDNQIDIPQPVKLCVKVSARATREYHVEGFYFHTQAPVTNMNAMAEVYPDHEAWTLVYDGDDTLLDRGLHIVNRRGYVYLPRTFYESRKNSVLYFDGWLTDGDPVYE